MLNGTVEFDGTDGFTVIARIPIRWSEEYDKVLIADDQELIRASLKIILNNQNNIEVTDVVPDGLAVLESVKKTGLM